MNSEPACDGNILGLMVSFTVEGCQNAIARLESGVLDRGLTDEERLAWRKKSIAPWLYVEKRCRELAAEMRGGTR